MVTELRLLRIVVGAVGTHIAAYLALCVVLLLPGSVPMRDAFALPILLVAGTAVAARWCARPASTGGAGPHGILLGAAVGLIAMTYGLVTGLLTGVLAIAAGWLAATASGRAPISRR